jgi:membrane protein YdbS with pleckstrin-like domain
MDEFESQEGDQIIGPAPSYAAYLLISNNLIWLGGICAALPFAALHFPQLQAVKPYSTLLFIAAFFLCMGGITWGKLAYKHTKYLVRDKTLYIYTGILNRTVNTIPLRFIFDCDLSSNLAEMAWGVQKIHLKVLEGTRNRVDVALQFIKDGEKVRDDLLSESATREANLITAI